MKRALWLWALVGCGGGGTEPAPPFSIDNLAVSASVVDQVVVSGEIVLNDPAGIGGTGASATFIDDATGATIATSTGTIGTQLAEVGDRQPFELTSIQARLLPHEDGYLRVCVDLQVDEVPSFAEGKRVGCADGEEPYVTPTTGTTTTTYTPPEEPPTATIVQPFDLELFGIGETVDLEGSCTDPNQADGTLGAVWTYQITTGGPEVQIYTDPIGGDGTTTGQWYNPPLGDYTIRLTCTDDAGNTGVDARDISVVDRQLTDLDGDGFTPAGGDCNDNDPTRYPGAEELCDGVDQDCDGTLDNRDLDGDGHVDEACTQHDGGLPVDDCDDQDPTVHPLATEIPGNGIDEDCDGYDA